MVLQDEALHPDEVILVKVGPFVTYRDVFQVVLVGVLPGNVHTILHHRCCDVAGAPVERRRAVVQVTVDHVEERLLLPVEEGYTFASPYDDVLPCDVRHLSPGLVSLQYLDLLGDHDAIVIPCVR